MDRFEMWFQERPVTSIVILVLLTVAAVGIVYLFARMLVKSLNDSAKFEQPLTTLMLILGTISIVALVGALFTKNESAFTIAATGVGAFAGALSSGAQKAIEHWGKEPAPLIAPVPLGPVEPEPEPPVVVEEEIVLSEESEGVNDDDDWDNDEDDAPEELEYVVDDEDLAEEEANDPRP